MSQRDQELYERCFSLALKMLEKEYSTEAAWHGGIQRVRIYNEEEVFKLADKLYKKIKSAK